MNNKKTAPAFPNFSWRTVISKKQAAKIRTKDKNKYKLFKRQPYKMIKYTQTIRRLYPTNCLSVFDHFVVLALKGLNELRGVFRTQLNICDVAFLLK